MVVFTESNQRRLHFLVRGLVHSPRQTGLASQNVRVKIAVDSTLEIISVTTTRGYFVMGALVSEALSRAAVTDIMNALTVAVF
jgi:hypothetical protein